MKHIKLFESFTAINEYHPYYEGETKSGESVFFFQEEDTIWYGIFPDDVAKNLYDFSKSYMDESAPRYGEELYKIFIDGRPGLCYLDWQRENEWRAYDSYELDPGDYQDILTPDGKDLSGNPKAKYGDLPLLTLGKGMITEYQGGRGSRTMTPEDYMARLDSRRY